MCVKSAKHLSRGICIPGDNDNDFWTKKNFAANKIFPDTAQTFWIRTFGLDLKTVVLGAFKQNVGEFCCLVDELV